MIKSLFSFLISMLIVCTSHANLFSSKPKFLSSNEAFIFSASKQENIIFLNWQIAEGYYLYKKEINLTANHAQLGKTQFPQAKQYHDEFFGDVGIFENQLDIIQPFSHASENAVLTVRYQGCTKGFCYPPETIELELSRIQTVNKPPLLVKSESSQLAANLSDSHLSILWFFILGLGLAFTPCVLPMLPLLSAIIIGNKNRQSTSKAFFLSIVYVQGMAITYTLLGLIVVAIGLPFQIALQSPLVLISLSILFTILACSMFGLFELKLPNAWQQKLHAISQKQQGGAFSSVFFMGMIAGLIASPCTSAPLSGALLYVAQSGDLVTGGIALYLLALGMGIPLILITLFGNKILPKSGDWLLKVKTAFGFVMLTLPLFLLSRILPNYYEPFLWSGLAIVFLIWLLDAIPSNSLIQKLAKTFLLILFALAAKPWVDLVWKEENYSITDSQHLPLERIYSIADLEEKLVASRGKKVMLDLYADWCIACKEFEKYTFSDTKVQEKLRDMVVLQMDMTHNSNENSALMQHFNVLGLPTILFFDENGNELTPSRVTGFLAADKFLDWLNKL